ncbi:MAG: GH39 family glycosyl hydrolase [Stackebrandtia sp.]
MRPSPRPPRRLLRALTAAVGIAALAAAGCVAYAEQSDPSDVDMKPAAEFQLGVTHGNTPLPHGDPAATERATEILQNVAPLQNQHIMGFGADNPWPNQNSDERDFVSLDARVEYIESTGAAPVVTLCCAPGWMKEGGDDWDFNAPLKPDHYDEYAQLSAQVAERYPQVEHFQVWNEFKGFWNGDRLDHVAFTKFYNEVYTAVKEVRPDAKIGGPYISLGLYYGADGPPVGSDLKGEWGEADGRDVEAIRYWIDNNVGADFFTLDAWTLDGDGNALDVDQMRQMFSDVTKWVTEESGLPVWWSEFYAPLSGEEPGDNVDPTTPEAVTAALEGMRDGGAAAALWWSPECTESPHPCYFTSTEGADGGQRNEFTDVAESFSAS